jgi:hypothetical protein
MHTTVGTETFLLSRDCCLRTSVDFVLSPCLEIAACRRACVFGYGLLLVRRQVVVFWDLRDLTHPLCSRATDCNKLLCVEFLECNKVPS